MEEQKQQIETLFERAGDYLETRLELLRLKATHKTTDVASSLASRLIMVLIIILVVLMINIGLALWLGDVLGRSYYGFFALGGFYILVAILFQVFKTNLVEIPMSNAIIKKLTK